MSVEIISDKFLQLAQSEDYQRRQITIRNWLNFADNSINPDILVLDLDLSEHTNENGTIPTFFSNIQELRECLQGLRDNLIPFLESGRVVIALVDERVGLMDFSNVDNLSWIDRLQSVSLAASNNSEDVELLADLDPLTRYFECVDYYTQGIRIESEVVSNPQILAQNPVSREPIAVALNEYLDPNGIPREMEGKLVLLPQPSRLNLAFPQLIQSLADIGEHFLESNNKSEINDEQGSLRLHPDLFDEELIARCSQHFNQGNHQDAIQNAFIALEERIRSKGDFSYDDHGIDLVTDAFNPGNGPLSFGEIPAEQEGVMLLYRSGFMAFRNPSSHRFLDNLDKVQAYHILCYANMLIRMLENNTDERDDDLHRDSA